GNDGSRASPEGTRAVPGPGYRWIALSNTTLGTLMATINGSIILIALSAWGGCLLDVAQCSQALPDERRARSPRPAVRSAAGPAAAPPHLPRRPVLDRPG